MLECRFGGRRDGAPILRFEFHQRQIAERFQQSRRVELGDPFQVGVVDIGEGAPRTGVANHFRFEQADNRFGERAIVRISATADGRFDAGIRQAFGIATL